MVRGWSVLAVQVGTLVCYSQDAHCAVEVSPCCAVEVGVVVCVCVCM